MPWIVNVLFRNEDEDQVFATVEPLVEQFDGEPDVSGTEHQSWAFETRGAAYAFGREAQAACGEQATVIEPEEIREE